MVSSSDSFVTRSSEDIGGFINNAVEQYLSTTQAPGVCIAVIDLNLPELARGVVYPFGLENLLDGQPVTPDTVFQIGSVTKVFTSLLTAYAVVQGRVKLTDKVLGFLSRYPHVVGDTDFDNIEIVNLATHTSGMPKTARGMNGVAKELFDGKPPSSKMYEYWNSYKGRTTLPPCWKYSNLGFVTLGFAVPEMFDTGTPPENNYDQLLQQLVTVPLGMTNTSARSSGNLATGYRFQHGANHPAPGIAYDLKSSGADLLTFLKANLEVPGEKVSSELVQAIELTQIFQGAYSICGRRNASMRMGLGWQMPEIPTTSTPVQMYYKNGATGLGGQSCVIEFVPADGFGIAVLTNQFPNDAVKVNPSTLATTIRAALTNRPETDIEIEQSYDPTED